MNNSAFSKTQIIVTVIIFLIGGLLTWQYLGFRKEGLEEQSEPLAKEKCVSFGEEISPKEYEQGVRCCSGSKRIQTSRYVYPCDTPVELACDESGCRIPPPTSDETPWWQCTPCSNGVCETEYGENACNCPEDCE
jgi:hypothetical protein